MLRKLLAVYETKQTVEKHKVFSAHELCTFRICIFYATIR